MTSLDFEEALHRLVRRATELHPEDLVEMIRPLVTAMGAESFEVFLVDQEQRVLVPIGGGWPAEPPLVVEATVAGRVYMSGAVVETPWNEGTHLFVPIQDAGHRLGVAAFSFPDVAGDPQRLHRAQLIGWVAGLMLCSKDGLTDGYQKLIRRREMDLAAELQWKLLPPLTLVTEGVAVAGVVEPAYQIGGDSFDFALTGDRLDVAIFDAVGHGLPACLPAAIAVGSLRHSRRRDLDLGTCYQLASEAIAEQFGDAMFVTAIIARLSLSTGELNWVSAGHPAPLVVRNASSVAQLTCRPNLPLGLSSAVPRVEADVLAPGDHLLLFTDGVVEGHARGAEPFGEQRLADLLVREVHGENLTAETVRRLAHAVLDHNAHVLRDDFTLVLVERSVAGASQV